MERPESSGRVFEEIRIMGTALALPVLSGGDSIESYIQRVNAIPMLTAEEETELAQRLQNDGDLVL